MDTIKTHHYLFHKVRSDLKQKYRITEDDFKIIEVNLTVNILLYILCIIVGNLMNQRGTVM